MKKLVVLAIVFALAVSCADSKYTEVIEVEKSNESVSSENVDAIPIDEALSALDRVLMQIDPPTRGFCRKVGKVVTISKERMFGASSRSASDVPEGDLLYVVNFEKNSGYAILGANNKFDSVIMIGDLGKFDDSVFDDDYDDSQDLPDSLRVTYADLYCEEDNEYYLGNNNSGNVTGDLVKDYMRIRTDFHKDDDFGGDDGGGVAIIHPLLKTLWHQHAPFNLYFHSAPASDTNNPGRRPAGCTTIAAAQIITCLKNLSLEDKFGITTSTWQEIEDIDLGNFMITNYEIQDVASMIKQMADGIGVRYNFMASGGTFATPQKVKKYLEWLGYDVTKYLGCKEKISDKIVKSLEIGNPVFIGALASNFSGHAWVIDGYMSNLDKPRFMHCNFGWQGDSNGWYVYSVFNSTDGTRLLDDKDLGNKSFNYSWWYRTLIIE